MNGRKREVENQRYTCRTKEKLKHLIIKCENSENQRSKPIEFVVSIIGQAEWESRLAEEAVVLCMVRDLCRGGGNKKESYTP